MRFFTWAAARMRGRNCRCLWLWQLGFGVSLRAATSNLSLFPQPLSFSNRSVLDDGESIRPSSFYKRTLPANKHVVQIFRFLLALQTVHRVSVEPRRRSTMPKRIERLLSHAVVPQSLPVSATTFPTMLSLYIAQGRLRKNVRYPRCSQRQKNCCHLKRKILGLPGTFTPGIIRPRLHEEDVKMKKFADTIVFRRYDMRVFTRRQCKQLP